MVENNFHNAFGKLTCRDCPTSIKNFTRMLCSRKPPKRLIDLIEPPDLANSPHKRLKVRFGGSRNFHYSLWRRQAYFVGWTWLIWLKRCQLRQNYRNARENRNSESNTKSCKCLQPPIMPSIAHIGAHADILTIALSTDGSGKHLRRSKASKIANLVQFSV